MNNEATVMVAEAWRPLAKALTRVLHMQHRKVTRVRWFEKIDGTLCYKPWRGPLKPVPESIRTAFVDAMTDRPLPGAQAIPELNKQGIACIGMAALPDLNKEMQAAGAKVGLGKAYILTLVYTGKLQLDDLDHVTGDMREELESFAAASRRDEGLKAKLDAILRGDK